jgi:hypothetical protein
MSHPDLQGKRRRRPPPGATPSIPHATLGVQANHVNRAEILLALPAYQAGWCHSRDHGASPLPVTATDKWPTAAHRGLCQRAE